MPRDGIRVYWPIVSGICSIVFSFALIYGALRYGHLANDALLAFMEHRQFPAVSRRLVMNSYLVAMGLIGFRVILNRRGWLPRWWDGLTLAVVVVFLVAPFLWYGVIR
jgi:uncharacterized membrane protein